MPTPLTDADKVLRNDTGKDIVEKLDDIAQALGVGAPASSVTYDNTDSGLTADDVQEAVDELASEKADKSELTSSYFSGTTNDSGSTIPAGRFFYLNGALVVAIADIANGATFTLNTNYTAVTAGVLNSLSSLPTVTPTSSDKLLVVQSQGQGLVSYGSKLDSANPTGTGSLSLNRRGIAGTNSVAIGQSCEASGDRAVAMGTSTTASGTSAIAEGSSTTASGDYSHSEGAGTTSSGVRSHAEGSGTTASGSFSHAEGNGTKANRRSQHTFGEYNVEETGTTTTKGTYVEIVGNGTNDSNRSNARTLDWSGNEVLAGDLTFNGNVSLNSLMNNSFTPTDLTLQNGAENYSFTSYYYKKFGRVTINMSLKSLSTASTVVATLPSGYKPRTTTSFVISDGTATGTCGLNIASSGAMTVWKSSTQYAIGEISFDAFN